MVLFEQRESQGDLSRVDDLAAQLGISEITARLLCLRGYDEAEAARAFLSPDTSQFHDPYLFPQMQDAVDCILAAGNMGARVCIYGDYDCDGICATALLARYLRSLDFDVTAYIPSRHDEGYGLNRAAIDQLAAQRVELIITVDCGITAVDEVAYAYEQGMEVVITDHHQCPPELPQCEAIINPAMGDGYPFAFLCGAGVAFKLVQAMGGLEAALPYLDIVSIATIADIVSLTGENRLMVQEGLRQINAGEACVGTKALAEVADYPAGHLQASHIAFSMAPRINAGGRMGSALDSLRLFLSDDTDEVMKLAKTLDEENRTRQQIEHDILDDAERRIGAREADPARDSAIVLYGEDWNPGVIGIVASRLVRRYHRPVLLFAGEGDFLVGSGRSVRGVHLHDELAAFRDEFERFGGHEMAAGLTIRRDSFARIKQLFLQRLDQLPPDVFLPIKKYDVEIDASVITRELIEEIERLGPFGTGNHSPVFLFRGIQAQQIRSMGTNNEHLRFLVDGMECVAFGMGSEAATLREERMDALLQPEINVYRGVSRVQARWQHGRLAQPDDVVEYIAANRYRFLDALAERIGRSEEASSQSANAAVLRGAMAEDAWDEWCGGVNRHPQGTLVMAFSPAGGEALLQYLTEKKLLDRLNIRWGVWSDECAYNGVLLAPDLEQSNLSGFERIFVWDDLFDAAAERQAAAIQAQWYVLGRAGGEWLRDIPRSREELIPVYRQIVAQARKQPSFADRWSYEQTLCDAAGVDRYTLRYALRIFSELDFLRIDSGMPYCVQINNQPAQRELDESASHRAAMQAYENFAARPERD